MKILPIGLLLLLFSSCVKEGAGGKATIKGQVKHHDTSISNAVVYIKYGAEEQPGTSSADYDAQTVASTNGAHYEFKGLQKGDYYLYSVGYDSTISANVIGGVPVKIKKKAEMVETDVPVTEHLP
ncbi:MAG: hypothetical protein COA57_08020 [Flavobacteriales bacterium]|nr:MAG: hypothetical protein COA57_08020 [Flavobacteriales bacterium]